MTDGSGGRAGFVAFLAVAVACLTACEMIQPAYRVELYGSSWAVESIDGETLGPSPKPTITFDSIAVIETGCRSVRAGWDRDTDGSDLSFYRDPAAKPQASCTGDLARQDDAVVNAIDSTTYWSVDSNDAIVLRGAHDLRLSRLPTPGS